MHRAVSYVDGFAALTAKALLGALVTRDLELG